MVRGSSSEMLCTLHPQQWWQAPACFLFTTTSKWHAASLSFVAVNRYNDCNKPSQKIQILEAFCYPAPTPPQECRVADAALRLCGPLPRPRRHTHRRLEAAGGRTLQVRGGGGIEGVEARTAGAGAWARGCTGLGGGWGAHCRCGRSVVRVEAGGAGAWAGWGGSGGVEARGRRAGGGWGVVVGGGGGGLETGAEAGRCRGGGGCARARFAIPALL